MNAVIEKAGVSMRTYYSRLLLGLIAYAATVYGALLLFESFIPTFPVWPANAILLVMLLSVPTRIMWLGLIGAVLITTSTVLLLPHGRPFVALLLSLCNVVEPMICALAMRNENLTLPNLSQTKTLMRFALFCIVLGPLVGGMLGGWFTSIYEHRALSNAFYFWTAPDMLAMGVFAPLLFALNTPALRAAFRPEMRGRTLWWLALIAVTTFILLAEHAYPLLALLAPLMLIGVFYLDFVSVVLGIFLVTSIAIGFIVVQGDAFMSMRGEMSLGDRILLLQFFILILLTMVFPTAAGIAEHRRFERALRRSERMHRLFADNTDDVILLLDENFSRTYVSPAALRVYGYTPELLLGNASIDETIHVEDRPLVKAAFDALRGGVESISTAHRIKNLRTNEWSWVEVVYKRVRTGDVNAPTQFVAVLRDITHRKAHEHALAEANRHLEKLAATDGLTGIANRHGFDRGLAREWQRGLRTEHMPGLLLIDVDHFKAYNDALGHQAGDAALKKVAQTIQNSLRRPGDLAARYGGEEFGVILPDTTMFGCMDVANKIRDAVRALKIEHPHGVGGRLTVSIGVVWVPYDMPMTLKEVHLIEFADRALYKAKHAGRDSVIFYDESINS